MSVLFHRFKTPGIAHICYLLASDGVGVIVDPIRDISQYQRFATAHGVTLAFV